MVISSIGEGLGHVSIWRAHEEVRGVGAKSQVHRD
jgi:hypothetical protein